MESGKSMGWDRDLANGQNIWFGDLETDVWDSRRYLPRGRARFHGAASPGRPRASIEDISQMQCKAEVNIRAEYRVVRNDGTIRWLADSGKFYFPTNGDPPRALGIAVDITERKQAEFALRESEERFRLMSNTAPVLIWMADTRQALHLLQQDLARFHWKATVGRTGKRLDGGGSPRRLAAVPGSYTQAFDRREPFRMEFRLRASDGEFHWLLDMGVPRFNSRRLICRIHWILHRCDREQTCRRGTLQHQRAD